MEDQVTSLFRDILLFCDEQDLIGKDMFAFDGCKLPSNASKEWSGTKEDFEINNILGLEIDSNKVYLH